MITLSLSRAKILLEKAPLVFGDHLEISAHAQAFAHNMIVLWVTLETRHHTELILCFRNGISYLSVCQCWQILALLHDPLL